MAYKFNPFTGKLEEYGPILTGTGTVAAAADGTAALPGISFANDLSVGIYRPGPEQLALSTNGTKRLQIDSGGNVSIDAVTDTGVKPLSIYSAARDSEIRLITNSGTEKNAFFTLRSANGNVDIYAVTGDITLNPGNTERLRITSAGLVGIGTSSPDGPLHVMRASAGTVTANGNADELVIENNSTGGISILTPDANHGYLIFGSPSDNEGAIIRYRQSDGIYSIGTEAAGGSIQLRSGNGTTALTIDSSQRVGIGTTSPSSLLHIEGTSGSFRLNGTASAFSDYRIGGTNIGYTGDAAFLFSGSSADFGVRATNNLAFGIGASEKARIDSSGRLLIGTSTAFDNFSNLQVADVTGLGMNLSHFTNTPSGGALTFYKSRSSTVGTNTLVSANDRLGSLIFRGADGTNYIQSASISAFVDGTPGANDMPGRLVFSTTADGASSPTEQLRITSDRYVRLASGTGGIQFNGDTAAANALDDYEEGTFTPTLLTDGGVPVTLDVTAQGYYRKIGSIVHMWGTIKTTTNLNNANYYQLGTGFTSTLASATHVGTASSSTNAGNANQKSVFSVTSRTSGGLYFVRVSTDYDFSNEDGFSFLISTPV